MHRPPRALVFGVTGQDGSYLARLLNERGFDVHGTSRDHEASRLGNLRALGIVGSVTIHSAAPTDFRSVLQIIADVQPVRIYNLSGQSSVGLSFIEPLSTYESMISGTLNILESLRFLGSKARFYNAASSESFGNTDSPATEETPFQPRSPYGVAKAAAFWTVANYREAYGLYAASGILFNHESPLRPSRFVTQKIIRGALDVREGREKTISLGDIDIARDWGWAPEFVVAMADILEQDAATDFVIATGETNKLSDFAAETFAQVGLDWREHVVEDRKFIRPTDISRSAGNPAKAERLLGWRPRLKMRDVIARLLEAERERRRHVGVEAC
jgi:GDPmannose 4,6-dehydratase